MNIVRTTNTHPDFLFLTRQLDAELAAGYGDLQYQNDALNKIEPLDTALVGYLDAIPVASGCNRQAIETKRRYVRAADRKRGFGIVMIEAG